MKGTNQKRKNSELPAGTQFRMPKKADDRTRPVPFQPQCVKIKAVLRMALRSVICHSEFLRGRGFMPALCERREMCLDPGEKVFNIQNALKLPCLSSCFSSALVPYRQKTLPAQFKGIMHSALYMSWIMSSGYDCSVGVVLFCFHLSQETMSMFVIF